MLVHLSKLDMVDRVLTTVGQLAYSLESNTSMEAKPLLANL